MFSDELGDSEQLCQPVQKEKRAERERESRFYV